MASQEHAPAFLLIVREWLRPGAAGAYANIERQIASASVRLRCPHPYLALALPGEAEEVWWLNAFASEAEKVQVEAAYARNEPLMAALGTLTTQKGACIQAVTTTLASYRADASSAGAWRIIGARYFVVNVTGARDAAGSVFESPDGQRIVIASVDSRVEAARVAQRVPGSVVLAVQPQWSYPAAEWIAADPELWSTHPAAVSSTTSRDSA
jgi:hypothetical protein